MTTLVTAAQLSQFRRMIAESTTTTYNDILLTTYIEKYPHIDQFGELPMDDYGLVNANWTATYDLAAAAADVWEEKAGTVIGKFDFSANGGQYSQSQQYDQYMKQCRYYRARRMPSTIMLIKYPTESEFDDSYIGNLPEDD